MEAVSKKNWDFGGCTKMDCSCDNDNRSFCSSCLSTVCGL